MGIWCLDSFFSALFCISMKLQLNFHHFMISESQALYSALCHTTSTSNRYYQIKLSWQTNNMRSNTESISHLLALLLDCIRTWSIVLKTGLLQYSSIAESNISICINSILKHDAAVLQVLPKLKLERVNTAGKWVSQTQKCLD